MCRRFTLPRVARGRQLAGRVTDNRMGPSRDTPGRLTPDPHRGNLAGEIPIRDPAAVVPAMTPPMPARRGRVKVPFRAAPPNIPHAGPHCLAYAMSHRGRTAADRRESVVSLPDLHVEPPVFCRAQDLLILYEDDPRLVRQDELADVVRAMLTQTVRPCTDDPTITPIDRHRAHERSRGSVGRRAHRPTP